ncbi:DoxX family protein [Acinetobacter sp. 194]|uniref:DoxX family protein n=1 Tax=Acinetobacter shaoyimingii TaxID=2715164 RepID=UPI001407341D|nr:DoxX family protein [Acinetobacter shaoyimingii]NHB59033.1 DoxX family protein [Acinetobacter shaoyimingii]
MLNTIRYLNLSKINPLLLLVSRVLLVILFIVSGLPKMMNFESAVQYMTSLHTPLPWIAAVIAVFMEVIVSILIIVGFYTRPLALIFAAYTLGTALIGHAYWTMTGADMAGNMIHFYKNISIIGGFLLLAITGPGRISLDKN